METYVLKKLASELDIDAYKYLGSSTLCKTN